MQFVPYMGAIQMLLYYYTYVSKSNESICIGVSEASAESFVSLDRISAIFRVEVIDEDIP